ncbi:hypothetical protein M407DRAFT_244101 [Tulasnella calospora MUT 4182]|uniref:Uncharacterized protein n=1 Tax=Tulasnella calospora MUT 4182 TaxID=1051891 RepID=A0A0C3QHU7_9AGAM|nr:hypothetical protein M407DRAFT_244101 [Tulasnella calospora MUT 4182]
MDLFEPYRIMHALPSCLTRGEIVPSERIVHMEDSIGPVTFVFQEQVAVCVLLLVQPTSAI